jgi:hypothetical protein
MGLGDIRKTGGLGDARGDIFVDPGDTQGRRETALEVDRTAVERLAMGDSDDDHSPIRFALDQAVSIGRRLRGINVSGVRADQGANRAARLRQVFDIVEISVDLGGQPGSIVVVKRAGPDGRPDVLRPRGAGAEGDPEKKKEENPFVHYSLKKTIALRPPKIKSGCDQGENVDFFLELRENVFALRGVRQ